MSLRGAFSKGFGVAAGSDTFDPRASQSDETKKTLYLQRKFRFFLW
jgi:hypothetical protein